MPGRVPVTGQNDVVFPPPAKRVRAHAFAIREASEGSETMRAWEKFLTGDPLSLASGRNFVVDSWMRSQELGINPRGRAAPLAARGDAIATLRQRNDDLLAAAAEVFATAADLLHGSDSLMLLTNAEGVVLERMGDGKTLDAGQDIHLTEGGDWREAVVGTNGIGTALATRRPAQIHAAEHFCEGIKAWTCAAAPIFEGGTGQMLGVIDISGPSPSYQRNNLSLAVAIARQIEMVLNQRSSLERMRLLEACLDRLSASDAEGLVAIDRNGRLVHSSGRVPDLGPIGQRLSGLDGGTAIEDWAERLPAPLRADWFNVVRLGGRALGAMLIIPSRAARAAPSRAAAPSVAIVEDPFARIVGRSPALLATLARLRQLADKRVPVLIEGETGVGKELFVRALHGPQSAGRPFVVFNCGAVVKELLASELFGYVRGAFTGATATGALGRFEEADGGTLCLDEIGEMPLDLQSFLLRVLEDGVVYRLGSGQPRRVDVRLVAMTNRCLIDEVAAGRFRRDLYHRLSVTRIQPPPLREREGDVDLLLDHFTQLLAARHAVRPRDFPPPVRATLRAYGWPGNVRELRNMVESLLLTSDAPEVSAAEVAAFLAAAAPMENFSTVPRVAEPPSASSLDALERTAIAEAVQSSRGNLAEAARTLGISRSTLYRKIGRYELPL